MLFTSTHNTFACINLQLNLVLFITIVMFQVITPTAVMYKLKVGLVLKVTL